MANHNDFGPAERVPVQDVQSSRDYTFQPDSSKAERVRRSRQQHRRREQGRRLSLNAGRVARALLVAMEFLLFAMAMYLLVHKFLGV